MPPQSTHAIRSAYLDFFSKKHGHAVIPSAPLLPENDPTTLFTGSGMQPMLPYLLGEKHPLGKRIVDSQRCFRTQDIEEIGDNRHTTFFEMLGNWSLGDYFKADQIPWMFEFLTKEIGLDPQRIYVTVFRGKDNIPRDDESVTLWKEQFAAVGIAAKDVDNAERDGMQGGRIFYYDEKKNWWSRAGEPTKMPVGEPGGPDSEMFWDFGPERKLHERSEWKDAPCHVNCDCGRYMEIGNNVFMEYIKKESGFENLAQKNVDFGGGLERISAAVRDHPDVFLIDLFDGIRSVLENASGKKYGERDEETRAFRIIMDHLRVATFLIADGAPPSNKDQGYFTRRVIRRAIRFAGTLGLTTDICPQVGKAVIETYKKAYPLLVAKADVIAASLESEEAQFKRALTKGEKELKEYLEKHKTLDGAKAFYFYETYGFPLELTKEIVLETGISVDDAGFAKAFEEHQKLSRAGAAQKFAGGLADHSAETTKLHTATHLLNAALRKVLGDHVWQKGSNITTERLRFDFTHPEKMTPEQIKKVEDLVNEEIKKDLPMAYHLTSVDGAKKEGAIGVFDDKYAAEVKVYVIGDGTFSKEICGGPHVARTGMLGSFKIQKEESSSAGVRRIKAIVSGGPPEIEVAREERVMSP
ncbi:MAG: alanine--tRNA ligase [Candidatus Peribacteraceae bacterium]|nr:alanine--tRNA ligase [Candidatus Peribacteraceae bacterium]